MAASRKRKRRDDEAEQCGLRKRRKLESANDKTVTSQPQTNDAGVGEPSGSLLMNLPGELRNHIYSFALVEDDTIQLSVWSANGERSHWREPGLLSVSKQVRSEASPVYYSKNCFLLYLRRDTVNSACPWIKAKGSLCKSIGSGTTVFDASLQFCMSNRDKMKFWIALTSLFFGMEFGSDYCTDPRAFHHEKLGLNSPESIYKGHAKQVRVCRKLAELEKLKESFYKWATFRGWDEWLRYEHERNLRATQLRKSNTGRMPT